MEDDATQHTDAMNNSDTFSEMHISDEDDYKTTIPRYTKSKNSTRVVVVEVVEAVEQIEEVEEDEEEDADAEDVIEFDTLDMNRKNATDIGLNWEADDEFIAEANDYQVTSDYAEVATAAVGKYEVSEETPATSAATPYHSNTAQHIQYPVGDVVFRSPSSTLLHYNYNYPHSQRQTVAHTGSTYVPAAATTQHPHHQHHPHHHPQQQQHHGGGGGGIHGAQGGYTAQPNMWYPNAPYSSGSFYPPYGQNRFLHYGAGYTADSMVDISNSGREARNRAEKNRRDKLNGSIQELSTMVPHVAESPRRVDKTAVLRFAAHGLRLKYAFRETLLQSRPQLTDSLMSMLEGFLIMVTCHGQIVLISSSIEQHLGHCQADLYGQNILHITHPADHSMLKQQLIPTNLENLFDAAAASDDVSADETNHRTQAEEDNIDRKLSEDKRSFTVRFARAGPRSEPTSYEVVKLDGCFRRSDDAPRGTRASSYRAGPQLIRKSRGRDDTIPLHTISGNDICLVAIARIVRPPKIINKVMEANNLEYRTRHLIDGRIIDCDQRIGIVAGYMTDEVRNLSPFTFMHQDDVRWVIVALRQMYDCNSSYGESTYRLLARNGHFVYLQSKGYLEIDKDTNKVHSFVCVNTLLDEEEGKRNVLDMKNKFSIIINKKIPDSTLDVPASEDPQQLEKAVLCLIQNLQKCSSDEEDEAQLKSYSASLSSSYEAITHATRSISSCSMRSTKTPPLALVPPEAASVKTSISNSVIVVNDTAAKLLRGNSKLTPPKLSPALSENDTAAVTAKRSDVQLEAAPAIACTCAAFELGQQSSSPPETCAGCAVAQQQQQRVAIKLPLKRSISCSESEEHNYPKRRLKGARTEIQRHIIDSLGQQERSSLKQQEYVAKELHAQSNKYDVANSKKCITDLMEEHQKQNKMFVNTTSSDIQNHAIDANTTNNNNKYKNNNIPDPQITKELEPI